MKILEKKTVWEGSFLRTMILTYEDHNGHVRKWEAVERVHCKGIVAIVPITAGNEVLLIRQFRPVLDNFVVEIPAGLNDRGESLVDAARRELVEETGYSSEEFTFLAEGPISSGLSTELLTVFEAKDVSPASARLKEQYPPDETEDVELIKVPLSDVYEKLEDFRKRGDYIDLKIYGFLDLVEKKRAGS